MPKALCKENLQFIFFRIRFSHLRQKDYSKPIIGREILLLTLWGFDGIKPCAIIYKTNHGPALQSLGIKTVYEFPRDAQYLKKTQPQNPNNKQTNKNPPPKKNPTNKLTKIRHKMFSLTLSLGYTLWKKSISHYKLMGLNRCLIRLPLKS